MGVWAPVYDARFDIGRRQDAAQKAKLKISRRASVRQATSEAWDNIALTLSTARQMLKPKFPRLRPYVLREKEVYLSRARQTQTPINGEERNGG